MDETIFTDDYSVGYADGAQDCAYNCMDPRHYYGVDLYSAGYKAGFNDQYLKHQTFKPAVNSSPEATLALNSVAGGDTDPLRGQNSSASEFKPTPELKARMRILPPGWIVLGFLLLALVLWLLTKDVPM